MRGINQYINPWSSEHLCFLKENYKKLSLKELSLFLKRSKNAIRITANKLGVNRKSNPNVSLLKEWQLGYLAGIIDGEGTIGIHKTKKRMWIGLTPRIRIGMTNKETIQNIYVWLKGAGFNPFYSTYQGDARRKNYEVSILRQNEIVLFLDSIIHYLSDKQDRAKIMISFCKNKEKKDNENALKDYEVLKQLNITRGKAR